MRMHFFLALQAMAAELPANAGNSAALACVSQKMQAHF
jgi:hypothetical protein